MGFAWNPVVAGVTPAKAVDINQIKTSTDTLADNLSISHYSWVEMPVSQGDIMEASEITELQDALDYIDTNNICSAENAIRYSTDDSGYDATADSSQNSTVDSSQDGTYNASQDTGVDSPQYTAVDTDQHNTYLNGQDAVYDVTNDSVVDAAKYNTVNGTHRAGFYAANQASVYSSQDSSVLEAA